MKNLFYKISYPAGIGALLSLLFLLLYAPNASYHFLIGHWRWAASICTLLFAAWVQIGHFRTMWALVLTAIAAAFVVGP